MPKEGDSYDCSIARTISSGNGAWAANSPPIRSCNPLSRSSSSFLIDWRPSRWLCLAQGVLALLAVLSLFLSALPLVACVLGALAIFFSASTAIRRLATRPAQVLRIAGDGSWVVLLCVGRPPRLFSKARLGLRGPIASLQARDAEGHAIQWNWWPDTLPAASRRQLRLASGSPIGNSGPALATMSG
jgi:toxin CptA